MLLRERETPEGTLVSVCDTDCLGETYENGTAQITVDESFYGGPEATEADPAAVVDALHRAQVGNIVHRGGRRRRRRRHRRRGCSLGVRRDAARPAALAVTEFETQRLLFRLV